MTSLTTALSRAECDERIQGRLDRRSLTLRIDPARPVRGRSSIEGFVLRHPRDAVVEASGTYLLGPGGGTRIDVRYGLAWRSRLWWAAMSVVLAAALSGVLLGSGAVRATAADAAAAFAAVVVTVAALTLVVNLAVLWAGGLVFGSRQRAYLRAFLERTLAAR